MPDMLDAGPLILSRWEPEEVDDVLEAVRASFEDLQKWMDWAQTVPTRDEQAAALARGRAAFDEGTEFGYVFRESVSGDLVGGGGVHRRVGPGRVEIGYWVRSDRHNRGYATTAAGALTGAVFTHLADVEAVEIHMDHANLASARIPEKLGYRYVRTERRERRAIAHTGRADVWETSRRAWSDRSVASASPTAADAPIDGRALR